MPKSQNPSSSQAEGKKTRNRVGSAFDKLNLPAELQQLLESKAEEAAGRPLSTEPGSPFAEAMGAFFEHALRAEFDEHMGYKPHQRVEPTEEEPSTRRRSPRNGTSSKTLKTPVGATRISVPRDRDDSFTPRILPKNQTLTAELAERIVSMYATGVTTRDIAEQIRSLYHFSASEDFVSDVVARVEPELKAWRNRPLEPLWAILYIDALHQKIRHSNGVRPTACYIVSGYSESGTHDVLGVWIAPSEHSSGHGESASFWHMVLNDLKGRGVGDALFVASDDLSGIDRAIETALPGALHIPCVVHQLRNSLAQVGAQAKKELARELKKIYAASTYEAAELALDELEQTYQSRYMSVVRQWKLLLPRLAVLWTFSPALRRMVYTTNPQENINRQVRKVTKNRGVLPSIDSALRLLTLVLRRVDHRAQARSRPDWPAILRELHLQFGDRLPENWGTRLS
jgi:putative transposase